MKVRECFRMNVWTVAMTEKKSDTNSETPESCYTVFQLLCMEHTQFEQSSYCAAYHFVMCFK